MKRVAILGASGHIAKAALFSLARRGGMAFHLFGRARDRLLPLADIAGDAAVTLHTDAADLHDLELDAILNAVGVSDLRAQQRDLFAVTEAYDRLVLDHQIAHPRTLAIHFSSGAAYGLGWDRPKEATSTAVIPLNDMDAGAFYSIAKLASEAKHRLHAELPIVDIRVFGFFSRFIDLDAPFLLSDMIRCVRARRPFETDATDFARDYLHWEDLGRLLSLLIGRGAGNFAMDARSAQPVRKSELVAFFRDVHHMETRTVPTVRPSPTGVKLRYHSNAPNPLGFCGAYTSLACVAQESAQLLGAREGARFPAPHDD